MARIAWSIAKRVLIFKEAAEAVFGGSVKQNLLSTMPRKQRQGAGKADDFDHGAAFNLRSDKLGHR